MPYLSQRLKLSFIKCIIKCTVLDNFVRTSPSSNLYVFTITLQAMHSRKRNRAKGVGRIQSLRRRNN